MNWRGQLNNLMDLKQKIMWDYKFGVNKENYILEYKSNPIRSSLFEKTFDKIVSKQKFDINYTDWKEDTETKFPKDVLIDKEKEIMSIFPKVNLKKYCLLSSSLDELIVIRTKKGLVIKGVIKGLRKC